MFHKSFYFLFISAIFIFTNGYAGDIIARVGSKTITKEEFEKVYRPRKDVNEDSLKQVTLERLITDKLFLIDAEKKGFDENIKEGLEQFVDRMIVRDLYNQVIRKRVKVPEYKIKLYWYKLGTEVKVRHILVREEKRANEVYKKLSRGENFATLAKKYSEDRSTKDKGGDLGWIKWGTRDPVFEKVAFSLRQGRGLINQTLTSKPIKTRRGYEIIQVLNKRKTDKGEYTEKKREEIRRKLERAYQARLADGYLEHLQSISGLRFNESVLDMLVKEFKGRRGVPSVSEDKQGLIVACWAGGTVTVKQLVDKANIGRRGPVFSDKESIKNWFRQDLAMSRLLPMTARRYLLHKQGDVEEKVATQRERLLISEYKREYIDSKIEIEDEDIEMYYEANREIYKDELKNVRYRVKRDRTNERKEQIIEELIEKLKREIKVEIYGM